MKYDQEGSGQFCIHVFERSLSELLRLELVHGVKRGQTLLSLGKLWAKCTNIIVKRKARAKISSIPLVYFLYLDQGNAPALKIHVPLSFRSVLLWAMVPVPTHPWSFRSSAPHQHLAPPCTVSRFVDFTSHCLGCTLRGTRPRSVQF